MNIEKIGQAIKEARNKAGLTQAQLAEQVGVSTQAVNKWERGNNLPDLENIYLISKILCVPYYSIIDAGIEEDGVDRMDVRDRLFREDHMFTLMRGKLTTLPQSYYALEYMREKHEGQFRKPAKFSTEKIPYINHPLMMVCQAHALGIRDDSLLAAILLHDVVEDTDVKLDELPFSDEVKELVRLVSFPKSAKKTNKQDMEKYYSAISKNGKACVIKVLDRCNNVSTMASSFDDKKLKEYILETEKYIMPLLENLKKYYAEYNDLAFLVKYHMVSVLETVKNLIVK